MGIESADAPRIATGFGGGVGGGGSLCGAVVGGVMAIGLKYGRNTGAGEREPSRGLSLRFLREFQKEMGSVICRELTGFDMTTPEGQEAAHQSDVRNRVCGRCIATAARLAEEELAS